MPKKVEVNAYFDKCMEKVLLRGGTESFSVFLNKMDRTRFFHYPTYALFGLDKETEPILYYGTIIFTGSKTPSAWLYFKYNGKEYIFSPLCLGIAEAEPWYKAFQPDIEFSISQAEFIDRIKDPSVSTYNSTENDYLLTQWLNLKVPQYIQGTLLRARLYFDDDDNITKFVSFLD